MTTTSPVTEYIEQYDELMVLHNNINKSLSEHIGANNITPTYLQELKSQQQNIINKTQELLANKDESFSEMGRLLNLKLMSLDQLINQDEVANQIVLALTSLLDNNNIKYTKQVNGSIQIK